jgi:plastocyanin
MNAPLRALAAIALAAVLCTPAWAARYTVTIENFQFNPPSLVIKAGDEVEWINKDIVEHTATVADRAFDSKALKPGRSWRWTAARAGRHAYACALHPTMTATLEVK